jgi:hypothetical protein
MLFGIFLPVIRPCPLAKSVVVPMWEPSDHNILREIDAADGTFPGLGESSSSNAKALIVYYRSHAVCD